MGKIILILAIAALTACSTGNCRRIQSKNPNAKAKEQSPDRVMVFKYDGSLQCGMGKPIPLSDMQSELKAKKINVHKSKSEHDGLMHIQMCGSPTGQANVFEISKKDLAKAEALGFKAWTKK